MGLSQGGGLVRVGDSTFTEVVLLLEAGVLVVVQIDPDDPSNI